MKKFLFLLLIPFLGNSQHEFDLTNLNEFVNPSKNWTIQGAVFGKPDSKSFTVKEGTGILVNTLVKSDNRDLVSKLNHGDIHVKFQYMLPKESNSGIYLQGRYEVQLLDSWRQNKPKYYDNGGIYERWDETRGKGKEGYEGYQPSVNASKAPGTWQELEIDFQAPRFDVQGKKIANAKFKKVVLNGVIIHQNIEVSGPTRGSMFKEEGPTGPIRIQGDHGPIAIKNFWYETFDLPSITLSNLQYKTYQSAKENQIKSFNIDGLSPVQTGQAKLIDQQIIEPKANFLTNFEGDLTAPASENYLFDLYFTGSMQVWLDGKKYFEGESWYNTKNTVSIPIEKGNHRVNFIYVKDFPWGPKALGVFVKRVGSEMIALHERTSLPEPDAIGLMEYKVSTEPVVQRSFMMEGELKNTYVVSVGTPEGVHYSYDLKKGDLIYVWRGKFLDVTQMWHDRGEPQTAAPLGQTQAILGKGNLSLEGKNLADNWQYKGYRLENGLPKFRYELAAQSIQVEDKITSQPDGSGLSREINLKGEKAFQIVLAKGKEIGLIEPNLWSIDGQYFIKTYSSTVQLVDGKLIDSQANGLYKYDIIW